MISNPSPSHAPVDPARARLIARFEAVRAQTEALARPLSPEDCQVQSMPDASPVKWHLAHVTWFFETMVLESHEPGFKAHNPAFRVLFNSYYNGVGDKHPRPARGLLTRPNLAEVMAWRQAVDVRIAQLLRTDLDPQIAQAVAELVELGVQHEQQHQELLLTDVKHLLAQNPTQPVYAAAWPLAAVAPVRADWVGFEGGLVEIGQGTVGQTRLPDAQGPFVFDNESPRHPHFLRPYALLNRLVTHGEWLAFVNAGGYKNPRWWLAAGWDWVQSQQIDAPLYWRREAGHDGESGQSGQSGQASHVDGVAKAGGERWSSFTLHGRVPLDNFTPITHISLYEADAYARWVSETQPGFKGARLPTEFEWEAAVAPGFAAHLARANCVESRALHPMPVARAHAGLLQAAGDVWEWTSSSYAAYPGYLPWEGAVGEYNGKFMANQYVLRGGSCATPASHLRATYRNFFPADARWQFTGLRLARDV